MEPNKNEKKSIGWPGEDLQIEKYSENLTKSLKKRERTVERINKVLKALNSNSFDVLIWIKGYKGKVFFFNNLVFLIFYIYTTGYIFLEIFKILHRTHFF